MTVTLKVKPTTLTTTIGFTDSRSTTACFDGSVFDSTVFDTDIIVDAGQSVKVKGSSVTVKVK